MRLLWIYCERHINLPSMIYHASEDDIPPTAVGADRQKEGSGSRYACDCKLSLAFLTLCTTTRRDTLESSMLGKVLDVLV